MRALHQFGGGTRGAGIGIRDGAGFGEYDELGGARRHAQVGQHTGVGGGSFHSQNLRRDPLSEFNRGGQRHGQENWGVGGKELSDVGALSGTTRRVRRHDRSISTLVQVLLHLNAASDFDKSQLEWLAECAPNQRLPRLPTAPHLGPLRRRQPSPFPLRHRHDLRRKNLGQMVLHRPIECTAVIGN